MEVCIGGRWGTVCDDAWDDTDASVVCRQLGLSPDDSQGRQGAFFGQGTGPIFFDQTECVGNESQLIDCPTDGVAVHNCRHAEDAAVVCKCKHYLLILLLFFKSSITFPHMQRFHVLRATSV